MTNDKIDKQECDEPWVGDLNELAQFAERYACQNERDYEFFVEAVQNGRLDVATQI